MIRKCLFPVAGYGTRFLPATKAMPKEMLPVVNKPLVQYGVEEAAEAKTPIAPMLNPPPHPVHDHLEPPASKQAARLLLKALAGTKSRVGRELDVGDQVLELEV